ncbi:type 2 DNA topoisomerase 6 subunit B-like [Eucyclogobius newberryi]|uniref:type 2 DNA topoisomerase 6 subunit B-like n=1 Tax=Eucyclogobius newberryi TaxID=166745 RepID=UPI003B5ABD67
MFVELKEVLRLLMLMTKQTKREGPERKGGLMVLLWAETSPEGHNLCCTVAAAGPWCAGIQMQDLYPVFAGVMKRLHPCPGPCPEPDIEDLCAFTDLHGSLSVFLSFLMKNVHMSRPKWQHEIERFLHTFSMTNAEIKLYLKLRSDQILYQREFGVKDYHRVPRSDQTPLYFDSINTQLENSSTAHLEFSQSGQRCHGGHPDIGDSLLLSIPPKVVEQGLFGTVTLQLLTVLSPSVLQYPNMATNLTQIKISFTVLIYSPSNVPVTNPSAFVQNFPSHLNCQELGLQDDSLSFQEIIPSGGTVYKVEQVDSLECGGKSRLFSIDQSLLLFLFLQHTDPFTTEISDIMATEVLLEHHLEEILMHNKQAVTNAMANELKKTMTAQNNRKKKQEKILSACEVICSSTLRIISCSSNMDFRIACLNSMKVHNTQQMSVAISESLRRVIFWKFSHSRKFKKCCSDQIGRQPKKNKHIRVEM